MTERLNGLSLNIRRRNEKNDSLLRIHHRRRGPKAQHPLTVAEKRIPRKGRLMADEMGTGPRGEVIVYEAPDGEVRVNVRLERETVWLTQKQMAALFDTSTDNGGLHLKNIFREGELAEAATAEESSVVQTEGRQQVRRQVKHYNLDAIISVGYRVNSRRGTQFRIRATGTLRDHLLRGYTLNERRLRDALGRLDLDERVTR